VSEAPPRWSPQDGRPETVAYAIQNSATVLPWSGTGMYEKLDKWLAFQAVRMTEGQLCYVRELYEMFEEGFQLDAVRQMDPDAYELHCSLCAYTLAAQANRLPI